MNNLRNTNIESYPIILNAADVAEILGISKRVAYEIMDHEDFPLFRIGRCKRVQRSTFIKWLDVQIK
jgi:predicted DNA-binding transcriptional regulator AlpA